MRRSDEMTSPSISSSSVQATGPTGPAVPGRRSVGIIIVALMALCLLFIAGYVQKLGEKAAVEAQIVAMEQQIEQAKVRSAILGKELAQVHDDADVAAVARYALNMVQEGDQLIAIVDAPAVGGSCCVAPRQHTCARKSPNWQRWLDLLFPTN